MSEYFAVDLAFGHKNRAVAVWTVEEDGIVVGVNDGHFLILIFGVCLYLYSIFFLSNRKNINFFVSLKFDKNNKKKDDLDKND